MLLSNTAHSFTLSRPNQHTKDSKQRLALYSKRKWKSQPLRNNTYLPLYRIMLRWRRHPK